MIYHSFNKKKIIFGDKDFIVVVSENIHKFICKNGNYYQIKRNVMNLNRKNKMKPKRKYGINEWKT